jgi:predicted NAD/FAD-dependent oxidoreductase
MYFGGKKSLKCMNHTIGLDARTESPINNYCRLDEIHIEYAPKDRSLWSITLRDSSNAYPSAVAEALAELIHCRKEDLVHLKTYEIKKALPMVDAPRYDMAAEQTQINTHVYLAGDYLLNGSIEAALRSGIRAAEAVTETLALR